MCLGIPGEVIELLEQPDLARVDVSGVRRVINIGLLADDLPVPGEWVLIHVGFALSKIDESEAAAALASKNEPWLPGTRIMSPNDVMITSSWAARCMASSTRPIGITHTGQPGPCTSVIDSGR